jgi:prepilin-type N-terminal cleavage/methylation domain-containing protein
MHGFTLLEVIVVAIVVAVLAAIAIPMYEGYVKDSELGAAKDLARAASMAADAYYRKKGHDPTVADLNLSYDDAVYTVTIEEEFIRVNLLDDPVIGDTTTYRPHID